MKWHYSVTILLKFSFQNKAICWLDMEFKEKNSILDRVLSWISQLVRALARKAKGPGPSPGPGSNFSL